MANGKTANFKAICILTNHIDEKGESCHIADLVEKRECKKLEKLKNNNITSEPITTCLLPQTQIHSQTQSQGTSTKVHKEDITVGVNNNNITNNTMNNNNNKENSIKLQVQNKETSTKSIKESSSRIKESSSENDVLIIQEDPKKYFMGVGVEVPVDQLLCLSPR